MNYSGNNFFPNASYFDHNANFNLDQSKSFYNTGKLRSSVSMEPQMKRNKSLLEYSEKINPLETIRYSNQIVTPHEWTLISKSLATNQNINTIVLSGINIDEYGLKQLGDIVYQNPCIRNLKLEWNYLCEYSNEFDYLCDCICRSKLIYLSLNNNKINTHMSKSIAKIIRTSNTILYIDLRWNEIGNEGAKTIVNSLLNANVIQELNLIGNKIGEDCLLEINDCIQRNKSYSHAVYKNENFRSRSNSPIKDKESEHLTVKENIPLKILEKEKEISEEFKARYDVQIISNSKLEKRNRELEKLLELERAKVIEAKEKFDKELKNEKEQRIKAEEQILALKEMISKMNVDKLRIENEHSVKILSMTTEISNLTNVNKNLQENSERLIQAHEEKVTLLKSEYDRNYEHLNTNAENLKSEYEKLKREFTEDHRNSLREYERKLKHLGDSLKKANSTVSDLERELASARKEALDSKLSSEIILQERLNKRTIEEENIKENLTNNYEKRIKVLESQNEELRLKYSELVSEMNSYKKSVTDDFIKSENKRNSLNLQIANLSKENTQHLSDLNTASIEIRSKEEIINKHKIIIQDLEKRQQELTKTNKDIYDKYDLDMKVSKQRAKQEKKELMERIAQLENQLEVFRSKLNKIHNELPGVSDNLKKNIFNFIDNSI